DGPCAACAAPALRPRRTLVAGEGGVDRARPSLLVLRQRVGHDVIEFRASCAVAERPGMDEDLRSAGEGCDEAVAFLVVPGNELALVAHRAAPRVPGFAKVAVWRPRAEISASPRPAIRRQLKAGSAASDTAIRLLIPSYNPVAETFSAE